MFTKKLEDQFSADLLNTVRGILDEAKHDKECECEKCEKEEEDDEDEDGTKKEGYMPTADEPTEANKKTAQKIRDMMAKEKKPAKKEVKEEKRGLWDNIHAKRKRIKAGSGERMRKPGSKGAPTDADFKAASEAVDPGLEDELMSQRQGESGKKWRVERAGKIVGTYSSKDKADVKAMKHPLNKVVAKEEAEQIDELSKSTLGSYIKKAAGSVGQEAITAGLKIKTGENPTKNLNKTLRRQKGIEIAANKLTKEEQEFIDALNNDTLEEEKNLTGLPKSTAEKNKQYIEVTHLLGHKRRVPVHPTNAYKALNRYRNDPSTKSARIVSEEIELEEGKMKDLVTKHMDAGHDYETALKKAKKDLDVPFEGPYRKPGVRKDQYGNVVKNVAKHLAKKAMAKEEVEQISEIGDTPAGKRALGRYIKDRRGTILGTGMGMERQNKDRSTTDKQRKDLGRKASNAFTGVARAVDRLTKEEQEFIDALNNDTLEEGRGRPPKEGSAAWHAKQQKDNDDMPALGVQLRKAKSMNKKVRFMDGKEHEIHPNHADRFEDHMAARKSSQEKAAFQKQAHKSHADFVKAVSAPVPKASKDTGEIVKYRH